jgi:hypothetical protein
MIEFSQRGAEQFKFRVEDRDIGEAKRNLDFQERTQEHTNVAAGVKHADRPHRDSIRQFARANLAIARRMFGGWRVVQIKLNPRKQTPFDTRFDEPANTE